MTSPYLCAVGWQLYDVWSALCTVAREDKKIDRDWHEYYARRNDENERDK